MGKKFFVIYCLALTLFIGLVVAIPLVAFDSEENATSLYNALSFTCHQKISRSLCIFKTENSYFIADCTKQNGVYVEADNKIIKAIHDSGAIGFKMPVCSRDVGIYGMMLLGGLIYPVFRKIEDDKIPKLRWFVLAIIPIGIDGTLQLLSNLGIPLPIIGLYESTNMIRLLTGMLAGITIAFYLFPLVNSHSKRGNNG